MLSVKQIRTEDDMKLLVSGWTLFLCWISGLVL